MPSNEDGGVLKQAIRDQWRALADRWRDLRARPGVQRTLMRAQYALIALVLTYLVYRLSLVGWREVIDNLPASPWFYSLFVLRYFALPLSEIPAYELVWRRPLWRYVTAFVRKRVYNFAVMGYSGEAFFTLWARRRLALSDNVIIAGVKDNNIISALASNVATVALIIALYLNDGLQAGLDALPGAAILFTLAFMSALGLTLIVVFFRTKILGLPQGVFGKLLAIHGARMALVLVLHAAMYAAALPGAPLLAWMMFIALQLVISRIPFVPNQDLVFLSAALTLSPIVGAPEAAIAGMLVAEAGLSQLFNFSLFVATAHDARQAKEAFAMPPGEAANDVDSGVDAAAPPDDEDPPGALAAGRNSRHS